MRKPLFHNPPTSGSFRKERTHNLSRGDSVLGLASSVAPALSRDGLVVHLVTKGHAELGPGVEVALGGDGTAVGALVDAVADVLDEGGRADDGGLVHLGVLPDVVDGAVAGDLAHLLALSGARAARGEVLDIVLDELAAFGPTVESNEDGAGLGSGGTRVLDGPKGAGLVLTELGLEQVRALPGGTLPPALAKDEVLGAREGDGVTVVGGVVLNVTTSLVVLVVVLAGSQVLGGSGELEVRDIGNGGGEGRADGGEAEEDRGEGNHFDRLKFVCWCL